MNDLGKLEEYYFGYICLDILNQIQKKFDRVPNNRFGVINYGNALRYGKMAVVTVASRDYKGETGNEEFSTRSKQCGGQMSEEMAKVRRSHFEVETQQGLF